MIQSTQPTTEQEKKEQEKINFQIRLARGNEKSSAIKTPKQMETIHFRIFHKQEVTPVVSMST